MGGDSLDDWTATDDTATNEELIRVSWEISSTDFQYLQSRILLRRRWITLNGLEAVERSIFLYPSQSPILVNIPIPPAYNLAGFNTFKVEVKRTARYRYYGLFEPNYSIKIEVNE
ncbi:MAG: hypothetical protein ACOVOV_02895 [Dolichospermum sp.]